MISKYYISSPDEKMRFIGIYKDFYKCLYRFLGVILPLKTIQKHIQNPSKNLPKIPSNILQIPPKMPPN